MKFKRSHTFIPLIIILFVFLLVVTSCGNREQPMGEGVWIGVQQMDSIPKKKGKSHGTP